MNEIQEQTEPKPAKKRAKPKKAKAKRMAKPFIAPTEFAGMSAFDCCTACNAEGCVITGIAACAHPNKGGLQAGLMRNPAVLSRYERAKKALAHQKIDLRGAS